LSLTGNVPGDEPYKELKILVMGQGAKKEWASMIKPPVQKI